MQLKGHGVPYRFRRCTRRHIPGNISDKLQRVLAQRIGKYLTGDELHRISSRYGIPVNKCRKWFVSRGVKIRGSSFAVVSATQSSGALSPQFAAKFSKCVVEEIERRRARGAIMFHLPYHVQIEMLKRTYNMMWLRSKFVEELAAELKLPLRPVNSWVISRAKKNRTCNVSNLTTVKQNMLREEMEKSLDFGVDRALMLSYVFDIPVAFLQKSFNGRRAELGLPQVDVMTELKTREALQSNVDDHVLVEPKLEKEKDRKMSIVLTPCNLQLIAPSLAKSLSSTRVKKSLLHPPRITSTLFREYKKSQKLTFERADRIASEIGLESLKVKNWFNKLRLKLNSTSLSQLESFLYENLRPDQASKLEDVFREKVAISVDEGRALAAQLGLGRRQVLLWFTQRRCYDILKSSAATDALEMPVKIEQPVPEVVEESRTEESTNYSSVCGPFKTRLSSLDQVPASTRIRLLREEVRGIIAERIPQLAAELNISPDLIQRFLIFRRRNTRKQRVVFRKTEDLLLMEEQYAVKDRIDRDEAIVLSQKMNGRVSAKQIMKWFYNTRLRRCLLEKPTEVCHEPCSNKTESVAPVLKSSTYKTFLFEEFKRSSSMDVTRRHHLAAHLGLTSTQVFLFLRSLMQSLNKPMGAVIRSLTSMSHSQLVKLTAEYHKSRFIAGIKRQMLSKQLGVSKPAIIQWFYNARCYELKTGEKFKPNTTATSIQKKLVLNNDEKTVEEPASSCTKKTNGLNVKHEQILRAELGQNDQLTAPRLLSLSQQLNLRYEVIEEWFAKNAPLTTRASDWGEEIASESAVTTATTATKCHRKLPLQKDMLFEEFKRAPSLSNERMAKLARQMDLSKSQVYSWFHDMRRKLAATPDTVLMPEYRNRDLNATQIARLEAEFAKHPYERDEVSEQLESELSLSPGQIRSWFDSRRLCDIRMYWRRKNGHEGVEKCLKKEKSVGDDDNDEWSFNPIITAIESKQFKEVEVSEHEFNEMLPVKTEKFPEPVSTEDIKEEPCIVDTEITEWNFKSEMGECNGIGGDDTDERQSEVEHFWPNSSVEIENDPLDTTNEERLEQEFEKESFPTNDEISSLADELQISQERVSCWFKNRRAKSVFTVEETGIEIIPEMILQVDLTTENDADDVFIPNGEDV